MNNAEKIEIRPKELEPIPSYVVSWDVPVLMNKLCEYKGWQPPTNDVYEDSKKMLLTVLNGTLGQTPMTIIDAQNIQADIREDGRTVKNLGYPIVNLDPIYGSQDTDLQLNITRGLNYDFSISEISRPGYPTIDQQVSNLKQQLKGKRDICLVDVGAYSGGSLLDLAASLRKNDINPKIVILGIATDESMKVLRINGILPISRNNIGSPVDWIESRDFVPFTPLSGRVVNEKRADGQISRSYSYIGPDISKQQMKDWTSLENCWIELSLTGWRIAQELYKSIEEQNGITITLNDLVNSPIRVSSPAGGIEYSGDTLVRSIMENKEQTVLQELI